MEVPTLTAILPAMANVGRRRRRSVADIPDADLLRRAVANSRDGEVRKGRPHTRMRAVMKNFGLGSTYAHQLCRRFGLDSDEMVTR